MARPCSVCGHAQRSAIDQALVAGESLRAIAGQFLITKSTLSRHVPHVLPAKQAVVDAHILDVVQQMQAINAVTLNVLHDARAAGDGRLQLQACSTVQRQVEFVHQVDQDRRAKDLETRMQALEDLVQEFLRRPWGQQRWPAA